MTMLPPGMDGKAHRNSGQDTGVATTEWPQSPVTAEQRGMERLSASNLRSSFRSIPGAQPTVRAVTPELEEAAPVGTTVLEAQLPRMARSLGSPTAQSSPRSISSGMDRRQGIVFNDSFSGSYDSSSSSPPPRHLPLRQRTHTMDGAVRQQLTSATLADRRHRVGSVSSASPQALGDDSRHLGPPIESVGFPSIAPARPLEIPTSAPSKEKRGSTRRLIKRQSSRPTSPLISPPPSVDSLPVPIPTEDANKVLLLMKNLCGRMRGEIEYQAEAGGPWQAGVCYVEEEKGCLMFDSGRGGSFHSALAPDLRGCRVFPVDLPEHGKRCLEIVCPPSNVEFLIRPLAAEEYDLWLAALLCWQQLRPSGSRTGNSKATSPSAGPRPEARRRGSSNGQSKNPSIIKVGKVMIWDKGVATSPRAIVKRPSTRDLRSSTTSWRRVSCILQDNGEFKLLTENDVSILSVIELCQLSRCAVQQLDRTVLDEEYCIAIFPIYSSTSTHLSIFRPIYIALDSRVHFEVWFVLLRAFAIPDMYRLDPQNDDQVVETLDLDTDQPGELFRVEKTLSLRVTEAKIKPKGPPLELSFPKSEQQEHLVGNYLAEVILDGEVRSRTTTKTNTKNPFWREDCEFSDLPSTLPYLSIILKKVDGNLESLGHQLQASMGLPKSGNMTEVPCGSVDISLDQLERGKDHEQWLQVLDDKQQSIGTMFLKLQHEELVVLLANEYQPLSELLHKFPSGLTSQIAEALPSSLRRLSELFLNIFQVSGSAGEWLMALVEDEIDGIGNQASNMKRYRFNNRLKSSESVDSSSEREQIRDMGKSLAGEANLLFRGNSLLTQSLEFHMRRLGKEYLEDMLLDKIFEINEINPSCEVDPSRMQPGEDRQQHWNQLMQLTTEVWQCIAESANRIPPELRQVLKYIRAVAEDRYGDFHRPVSYTSVSGFLFLRFICPAILSPKLFGLLRDHPRPRAQRTLTLIAKALQALANLTTFGQKESWMEPMNKFLNSQRQSVKDYIDQVCAVPVERGTYTLPASYSTPITILGRLSPAGREGFPSLPYLIDHARTFAALVKLWNDMNPPTTDDGDLFIFNEMCAALQRRADDCHTKIEHARGADATPQTAEDLLEPLEHTTLLDPIAPPPHGSQPVWMDAENLRPPGSSGSDVDPAERRSRDARRGRESSSLRNVSGQSDMSSTTPSGTLRSSRNGRTTRNILSGIMRMGRSDSPDASPGGPNRLTKGPP